MLHTNIIAKIEKTHPDGLVDLEPMFLDEDEQEYKKIVNARILYHEYWITSRDKKYEESSSGYTQLEAKHKQNKVYDRYEKGDIVMVAIIERDLSDAVEDKKGNGDNWMLHDLSSAVVLGKVM